MPALRQRELPLEGARTCQHLQVSSVFETRASVSDETCLILILSQTIVEIQLHAHVLLSDTTRQSIFWFNGQLEIAITDRIRLDNAPEVSGLWSICLGY